MIIEKDKFIELFSSNGIEINDEQYEKFLTYSKMLVEWNNKCNLTAILDPEGMSIKHFFDSVFPFAEIDVPQNAKIIDVGTGAGFPSVPLAIIRNDLKLTLLDGLNKRINFLKELTSAIDVSADCVHGRAEEFGQKADYREKYDIATARAVASLPELCEYCLPFVKVGGLFVSLKGSNGLDELKASENAISTLGGKLVDSKSYKLPNGDGRTLVVIKKISQTPTKYPRNKGQMTKKPL